MNSYTLCECIHSYTAVTDNGNSKRKTIVNEC